jgi:hypothetical protein
VYGVSTRYRRRHPHGYAKREDRVAVRIEIPPGGYVRVFQVSDDGSETEIQEVRAITIRIRPDDLISATVETNLAALKKTMSVVSSHTVIHTLCPRCEHDVFTPTRYATSQGKPGD